MAKKVIKLSPSGPLLEVLTPSSANPPNPAKYLAETGEYTIPASESVFAGYFGSAKQEQLSINIGQYIEFTSVSGLTVIEAPDSGNILQFDDEGIFQVSIQLQYSIPINEPLQAAFNLYRCTNTGVFRALVTTSSNFSLAREDDSQTNTINLLGAFNFIGVPPEERCFRVQSGQTIGLNEGYLFAVGTRQV